MEGKRGRNPDSHTVASMEKRLLCSKRIFSSPAASSPTENHMISIISQVQ